MPEAQVAVKLYEPWMRDQIIGLTEMEYPFMKGWYEKRFEALYESEFLKNRNGLIVAVAGSDKIIACISYIYWPVSFKGKILNSYQMVGLIVDPAYRGIGLFKKTLSKMDEILQTLKPDVVIGFPVEESKQGFLKQGWKNNFNLAWYLMPVNPISLFKKRDFTGKLFDTGAPIPMASDNYLQTAPSQEFWNLRENFFPDWPTYHKTYTLDNENVQIIFRIQKIRGYNVAVIGRVYSGNASLKLIYKALKLWVSDLRKNGTVLAATAAVNESCASGEQQAIRKLMFRTNKNIVVIVKSYADNPNVADAENWNLMRGDMETW